MTSVVLFWLSGIALAIGVTPVRVSAADNWIEVKSPHFTILSNAGDGSTRNLPHLSAASQFRGGAR